MFEWMIDKLVRKEYFKRLIQMTRKILNIFYLALEIDFFLGKANKRKKKTKRYFEKRRERSKKRVKEW